MTCYNVNVTEKVRFADVDAFCHLNNATYFTFFEQARIAYMRELGLVDDTMQRGTHNFILLETRCRFILPCFLDEQLRAEARVEKVGRTSCEMTYRLVRGSEVVAEGSGVVVYFDYDKGTKAEIPQSMRDRIAEIEDR